MAVNTLQVTLAPLANLGKSLNAALGSPTMLLSYSIVRKCAVSMCYAAFAIAWAMLVFDADTEPVASHYTRAEEVLILEGMEVEPLYNQNIYDEIQQLEVD